jgi:hypothetical protein
MKELVFALQIKGKARLVEEVEVKLAAKTTAAGQVLRTAVTSKGIQAKAESRPGPRATFESEVQMTGAGTFIESGREQRRVHLSALRLLGGLGPGTIVPSSTSRWTFWSRHGENRGEPQTAFNRKVSNHETSGTCPGPDSNVPRRSAV